MTHTDAPGAIPPADAPVEAGTAAAAGGASRRRPKVPAQRAANGSAPAVQGVPAPAAVEVTAPMPGMSDTGEFRLPPRGPDDTGTDLVLYVPPAYLNIGPPIPPKSGRGGFFGVIALIVVLFLVSVLATVAYFGKSGDYDRQAAALRNARATMASQQSDAQAQQATSNAKDDQIAALTQQLTQANDQLATLRSNATGDASKLNSLAEAQAALAACITADRSYIFVLKIKAGAASISKAAKKANTACSAADKFMP